MGIDVAPPTLVTAQTLKQYGSYKFQRLPPNQGSSTQNIGPSQYYWLDFEIAPTVMNLPKSCISWQTIIQDDRVSSKFPWVRQDCFAIIGAIRMKIIDGSAPLIDIPYFPQYHKIFLPRETRIEEGFTRDYAQKCFAIKSNLGVGFNNTNLSVGGTTAAMSTNGVISVNGAGSYCAFIHPTSVGSSPLVDNHIMKANGQEYGASIFCNSSTAATASAASSANARTIFDPSETVQCISGTAGLNTTGASDYAEYNRMDLSSWKQTICNYIPDQYLGQRCLVSVQFGPTTWYVWNSTSANDPSASCTTRKNTSAQVVQIVNPILNLAVQNHPQVAADIRNTELAKQQKNLPFVLQTKQLVGNSSSSNLSFNFPLSRQHGTHCKGVTWALFGDTAATTDATANTGLDNSNVKAYTGATATNKPSTSASKVQSFRSSWGAEPLQFYDVQCDDNNDATGNNKVTQCWARNDDYWFNKELLKGSMIDGLHKYRENWHHTDWFAGPNLMDPWHSNEVAGKALSPDNVQYTVTGTLATAVSTGYNVYIHTVLNRVLTISETRPAMFQ